MKRIDFYKEYYHNTNRMFSDHIIWTQEDEELTRQKGQIYISKSKRKFEIILQYAALIVVIVGLITGHYRHCITGLICFLLTFSITDFSIIKIEALYHIFNRSNTYSLLLYQAFCDNTEEFRKLLLSQTKTQVKGIGRDNDKKLSVRYRVIMKNNKDDVFIIIKPKKIMVKTDTDTFVLNDVSLSFEEIIYRIAEILNSV